MHLGCSGFPFTYCFGNKDASALREKMDSFVFPPRSNRRGEVEKRERMLKDFAVGLGGPDFDGEHDAFKVLAQFETGKQRPNTAIPIGDHCEAIATLAQGLERGEDVVVNTPGSGLRESLVE